jgi:mannose-6-phosphate isomerase-like protein (cupin superfamily)
MPARKDTDSREFFRDHLRDGESAASTLIVFHQRYDGGGDTGGHHHEDFYALYVVQGGRGVHVINDHPYQIARGDVYITPPGTTHRYQRFSRTAALRLSVSQADYFTKRVAGIALAAGILEFAGVARCEETTRLRNYHLHLSPERHREVEGHD